MNRKLGDVCQFYAGTGFPVAYQGKLEGELPFYKVGDIANNVLAGNSYLKICNNFISYDDAKEIKGTILPEGTIVFAKIGEALKLNRRAITSEDCLIDNNAMGIAPKKNFLSEKYFYYFMKQLKMQDLAESTTVPSVRKSKLEQVEITVPSIERQIEIEHILDNVSKLILMRKQELKALDELIKARFVEMFGNPLDSNKVNYIFTECVEFNPKKSEVKDLQDVEVAFVPMECVGVDGSFSIKGTGLVSEYYSGYTYFRDGDVLLAKITPCFENGKVAIATDCKNGIGFGTTEFHVSRPLKGITNSVWVKYLLKNDMVHDLATINMSGSAGQKRIQTPFFNKLKIYVPPIEEQEQFADYVHQVDKSKVVF